MPKRIVELKLLVVDELGDAVDLVFALVHDQLRIRDGDTVDVTVFELALKNGPLFDADANFELVSRDVRRHEGHVVALCLHHGLKVDIDLDSGCLVVQLTLIALPLDVIHAPSPLFSLDFQLFDLFQAA